jgi:Domain of unknown function (DUF4136)
MKKAHFALLAFALLLTSGAFGQKIKVGYAKNTDFSKYKTYTWAKPEAPIMKPFVYENVVGTIDDELKAKGLSRVEQNGDLTLVAAGGIGLGYNMPAALALAVDNWDGEDDPAILLAPMVAEGKLVLGFIDRANNKLVWRGTATENLDPEVAKSLPRIEKAVVKLLKGYPPKRSR